jgi:Flp pilus assembly protein TadD
MRKGTILSSGLIAILLVVLIPNRSIVTAGAADLANFVAVADSTSSTESGDATTDDTTKKKKGGFMRALGAPFRAIGRIFGGNDDKNKTDINPQQARRISNKEAKKFEVNNVTRIKDANTETPAPSDTARATPILTPDVSPAVLHLQQGRALLQGGNVDQAISELTAAIAINPKLAEANNLLGVAYESKGSRDRALKSLEAAVQADKNNTQYLNNLGYLLFRNNDFEAAAKYLKRAAKLSPKDPRIWNNLGLAQCQRGKFDDAFESFTKAVGEFKAHMSVAAQLSAKGYGQDAIKHLEAAYAMNPQSIEALEKLAPLYAMTGRNTDAENARRSLLALRTFADANKK